MTFKLATAANKKSPPDYFFVVKGRPCRVTTLIRDVTTPPPVPVDTWQDNGCSRSMGVNHTNHYSKLIFTFLPMPLFHQPGSLNHLRQGYSSSQSVD
ncbi:hypothetical protein FEZ34_05400 [Lacticaseibacillus casei]|nr:hypothetical protein FEZ34_05400 [Lacticaseibacillus casei]